VLFLLVFTFSFVVSISQCSHSEFSKIPRSCYEKSQDWTVKIPKSKLTPKYPKSWEKSQAVGALDNSKSNYTIVLILIVGRITYVVGVDINPCSINQSIVLDLRSQTTRMSKLHSEFYLIHNSKKSQKLHGNIPKSQVDSQIPKNLGKIPSSGSAGISQVIGWEGWVFCTSRETGCEDRL